MISTAADPCEVVKDEEEKLGLSVNVEGVKEGLGKRRAEHEETGEECGSEKHAQVGNEPLVMEDKKVDRELRPPSPKRPRVDAKYNLARVQPSIFGLVTDEETKEDYKKLAILKNPNVKQNEALALLPQTLRDHLRPVEFAIQEQYFTIDETTRDALVTRKFISTAYGGNTHRTFPKVSKAKLEEHGMNDFMFLTPTNCQPEAPLRPGAPGLWLRCAVDAEDREDAFGARVFAKIVPVCGADKNMYRYMERYQVARGEPPYLTVEEYKAQTPRFRDGWAKATATQAWGAHVVVRVLLRRELGREPTREEVDEAHAARYPQCAESVRPEEIKAAYAEGKEMMGVWTMKCVGYDNALQHEMSEKYPVWWAACQEEARKKTTATPKRPRKSF